ncbi:MAG: alanyl-tRNA editing protein [Acidobacteriia bacterium]|nr:alanyl-tRNA editing protein [Methyloceanibacter sp.]MBX5471541.1 alanyl-tRNA editing protein [Acetobacteraceae bacterium]MCL6490897.1 alanyl-tRNA editing protein [Terriglobia bacterium]
MTELLYLENPALSRASARVMRSRPDGIVLDRTVFYPRGGGQPGDSGRLRWECGEVPIVEAVKGEAGSVIHLPAPALPLPEEGSEVEAEIDRPRRMRLMRMHTALHLLCSLLPGAAVTGGQVGTERSRLDFDLPNPPAREALEEALNALVAADHPVQAEWVDEAVLDANPDLVRTLSVKPPRGAGRIRLIRIGADPKPIDLQPCGGTHVAHTGEIGPVRILKIESKGRQNRRIVLALAEET